METGQPKKDQPPDGLDQQYAQYEKIMSAKNPNEARLDMENLFAILAEADVYIPPNIVLNGSSGEQNLAVTLGVLMGRYDYSSITIIDILARNIIRQTLYLLKKLKGTGAKIRFFDSSYEITTYNLEKVQNIITNNIRNDSSPSDQDWVDKFSILFPYGKEVVIHYKVADLYTMKPSYITQLLLEQDTVKFGLIHDFVTHFQGSVAALCLAFLEIYKQWPTEEVLLISLVDLNTVRPTELDLNDPTFLKQLFKGQYYFAVPEEPRSRLPYWPNLLSILLDLLPEDGFTRLPKGPPLGPGYQIPDISRVAITKPLNLEVPNNLLEKIIVAYKRFLDDSRKVGLSTETTLDGAVHPTLNQVNRTELVRWFDTMRLKIPNLNPVEYLKNSFRTGGESYFKGVLAVSIAQISSVDSEKKADYFYIILNWISIIYCISETITDPSVASLLVRKPQLFNDYSSSIFRTIPITSFLSNSFCSHSLYDFSDIINLMSKVFDAIKYIDNNVDILGFPVESLQNRYLPLTSGLHSLLHKLQQNGEILPVIDFSEEEREVLASLVCQTLGENPYYDKLYKNPVNSPDVVTLYTLKEEMSTYWGEISKYFNPRDRNKEGTLRAQIFGSAHPSNLNPLHTILGMIDTNGWEVILTELNQQKAFEHNIYYKEHMEEWKENIKTFEALIFNSFRYDAKFVGEMDIIISDFTLNYCRNFEQLVAAFAAISHNLSDDGTAIISIVLDQNTNIQDYTIPGVFNSYTRKEGGGRELVPGQEKPAWNLPIIEAVCTFFGLEIVATFGETEGDERLSFYDIKYRRFVLKKIADGIRNPV